jgi:hypothetical protein
MSTLLTQNVLKKLYQTEITEWAKNEFRLINKERTYNKNISFAFSGIGTYGELFALLQYPNSKGSGSKGGCAFDNKEMNDDGSFKITREIKFVSLDGSKICDNKKCKTKTPCFQTKCIECDGNVFNYPKDSRWGIGAKEHIKYHNTKYMLNEYILYKSEYDLKDNSINLKCFKIMSSNDYFNNYINNQFTNGKGNTCNLMPDGWDFHLSGPIELFNININNGGLINETVWDLDNNTPMKIPKTLIIKNKKNCSYEYKEEDDIPDEGIEYESIISFCSIKKKSLGKSRGNVSRK